MARIFPSNISARALALGILSSLLICGCGTIDRPEQLRAIRREIGQCNDDLNNAVQVLSYCARMTNDSNLANRALDGVLEIIGEPSPEEKIFAASLDSAGCEFLTANARGTISHRDKLLRQEHSAESALSADFHRYARQASTFRAVKWLSISTITIFVALAIARKIF
ncbi:MAG: hypothetical protein LBT98_03485 [Puniceicoccales bacterium]|nr:hypothetical protein [Puniceicoccales bacterium]